MRSDTNWNAFLSLKVKKDRLYLNHDVPRPGWAFGSIGTWEVPTSPLGC